MSREQNYFPPSGTTLKWGSKALTYSPARLMALKAISDLSRDKRVAKLWGHTCVADFEITPERLRPYLGCILAHETWEIFESGQCEDVNIGLYSGGEDIRVWPVFYPYGRECKDG